MHKNAHDITYIESRSDLYVVRGVSVHSPTLGLSGTCDILEFYRSDYGIPISSKEGLWLPYPVEYKRGVPKASSADRLQLCAQALCLEEMLCCEIPKGALYYGEIRKREEIEFTNNLRNEVACTLTEMRVMYNRKHTPKAKKYNHCNSCSLIDVCLPDVAYRKSAAKYISRAMEESI